jgi:SAM-dependent methyltransferase
MTAKHFMRCSVCDAPIRTVKLIGGLRRSACEGCGHSERLDIERFDYHHFAMGSTGVGDERTSAQARFIAPYIPINGSLLEIGCAAGGLAAAIRAHSPVARYEGVEFSPARTVAATILDSVHERSLDELIDAGTVREQSFDMVLASHCLEHVEGPARLVADMLRALRPGGALFIEVPNMSGHPALANDDNRSHIHFFSIASLSRLLIDAGLQIVACATGARLDARYPDSIRAIARNAERIVQPSRPLSDHPMISAEDAVVFWGAGRMAEEMIDLYFDTAKIAYFVDRDPAKHGLVKCGAPIRAPETLRGDAGRLIVINSLEMENEIRQQIEAEFSDLDLRLIGLSTLLDAASSNRN